MFDHGAQKMGIHQNKATSLMSDKWKLYEAIPLLFQWQQVEVFSKRRVSNMWLYVLAYNILNKQLQAKIASLTRFHHFKLCSWLVSTHLSHATEHHLSSYSWQVQTT